MLDLAKCGHVVGALCVGNVVQLWCRSLDGGATDSRIIPVSFETEEMARYVALSIGVAVNGGIQ